MLINYKIYSAIKTANKIIHFTKKHSFARYFKTFPVVQDTQVHKRVSELPVALRIPTASVTSIYIRVLYLTSDFWEPVCQHWVHEELQWPEQSSHLIPTQSF